MLGKFKDETNSLVIKEFIALSPKSYAYSYQTVEERTDTSTKLKGVSRTVVKKEIKLEDHLETLRNNRLLKNDVVSIRSMNHQLYTLNQQKIALTSFYDTCILVNEKDLVPFGCAGNGHR